MGRQTPPKSNATRPQKQAKSPKLKIRQTPNAFFLFRTHLATGIREKNVDIPHQSKVSKLAGDIPHHEKLHYEHEAAALREQARQEEQVRQEADRKRLLKRRRNERCCSNTDSEEDSDESEDSAEEESRQASNARTVKRRKALPKREPSPPPPTSSRKRKAKRPAHPASGHTSAPSRKHTPHPGDVQSALTAELSSSAPKKPPVDLSFVPTVVNFLATLRAQGTNDGADANPSLEDDHPVKPHQAQSMPSSPAYRPDEMPPSGEDAASSGFSDSAWDSMLRTLHINEDAFDEATDDANLFEENYSVVPQHPLPDLDVASHYDVQPASSVSALPQGSPQYKDGGTAPSGVGPSSCFPFSQCIPSTHAHVNDSGAFGAIEEAETASNYDQVNDWYQKSHAAYSACRGTDYGVAPDNNFDRRELARLHPQCPSTTPVACSHASDDLLSKGASPLLEEYAQAPVDGSATGAAAADSSSFLDLFPLSESADFSQAVQEWRLASS
ncbi:hypothetical protein FB107DRAFT_206057 [Schizophyllum commune]